MKKLKYSSGEKERINVSLDKGVVKKTKKILESYDENFSSHIEQLLDQWCYDQDDQIQFQKLMEKITKNLEMYKETMTEKEFENFISGISTERIKKEVKKK